MTKRIYTLLLSIFLFLATLNISIRYSVSYSLCLEEVGHAFAIRMNDVIDTVYGNSDIETLIDIQNSIGKEKSIRRITEKYIDATLRSILLHKSIEFNDEEKDISKITNETLQLITAKLDDSWKEDPTFIEDLCKQVENGLYTLQVYTEGIGSSLANHKAITILYYALTSTSSCIFYSCAFVLFLVIAILRLNKKDLIHACRISLLASGICIVLAGYAFHAIAWKYSNRLLGRTINFVTYPFMIWGLIMLFVVFITIVYEKMHGRVKKRRVNT